MQSKISAREKQIIQLIAYEHNSKEIAQQLYISEHTVMSHRKNLNMKLDVRNSAGLVRRAIEMGIVKVQVAVVLFVICSMNLSAQEIIYVDHQATETEDGTTWARAYRTLNLALDIASVGDSIFISEGTYTPLDTGRTSSFILNDGVTIVGGFDPHNGISEYEDISSPLFNRVTLSGDIGTLGDSTDNSYHVLTDKFAGALSTGCRLIGLYISDGYADGDPDHLIGGGIYVRGGRLKLEKCTVFNNRAHMAGSAIYAEGTILNLVESSILDNFSVDTGSCNGAIYLSNCSFSSDESVFFRNSSGNGGALYSIDSDINLIGCNFSENIASQNGGAVLLVGETSGIIDQSRFYYNDASTGGGLYFGADSLTAIFNSIIYSNYGSNRAGGIYVTNESKVELINSNVNFNESTLDAGAGIYNNQSDCSIFNSIICCNQPDIALGVSQNYNSFNPTNSQIGHSFVEYSGGSSIWSVSNTTDLGGNLDISPNFNWNSTSDSLAQKLDCSSQLINKGNNVFNTLPLDYGNLPRIVSGTIDIGAHEFQDDETNLFWTGSGDGINWNDPDNWSCLRLPTQFDEVTIESIGDTIIIDTGIVATALTVIVRNFSTLLVKEDIVNQNHGKLITSAMTMSFLPEMQRFGKSSATADSSYLLNQGVIEILNGGLNCEQYCHITNQNELELNGQGIILNHEDRFINEGLLRINVESDEAISIGEFDGSVPPSTTIENHKKSIQKAVTNNTLHNLPTGEINIVGTVLDPNDLSFDSGIEIQIGRLLNEGTINMRNVRDAVRIGEDLSLSLLKYKLSQNMQASFQNDGLLNIIDSRVGIQGNVSGGLLNNGMIEGQNLWICPLRIEAGFELFNFGEIDLGN